VRSKSAQCKTAELPEVKKVDSIKPKKGLDFDFHYTIIPLPLTDSHLIG
jgi:hypothetical protein